MIREDNLYFSLETNRFSYIFKIQEPGIPVHLYAGAKIPFCASFAKGLEEQCAIAPGNAINYGKEGQNYTLENLCMECSSTGKGDVRSPFVCIQYANGSQTSDFLFERFEIDDKKEQGELPGSVCDDGEYEHLAIFLRDAYSNVQLQLHYYVYPECDCITRLAMIVNEGQDSIQVQKLMSLQLDLNDDSYDVISFSGAWAREFHKERLSVKKGMFSIGSRCGVSSNRFNPFCMLARKDTTEMGGDCFAFNLIYSGNHQESFETNSFGKLRVLTGIHPEGFSYLLEPGETFTSPEAVFSFSNKGFHGISENMHDFVNTHIIRGKYKNKLRPVLLNSWEANYFQINEQRLVSLAKAAADVGIELLVMDDGWFGERNDDTSSLGDWFVNSKKLPGGLNRLAKKVNEQGVDFGIWIEPEMVNVNSKLYREHPEYAMEIPGRAHSEGRNQRILDYTKKEVRERIIQDISEVLSSANISYVKWDMNRIFSDVFSDSLPLQRQGEVGHRYVLGLYEVMRTLTTRFPDILFEGCASGGNRFDLGILSFFPQIWASDDTDAYERAFIQNGYSYGYPSSCVTAHVSDCPNHQTLRNIPLETRFNVACFGNLGYELNLADCNKEELNEIREQIRIYKENRELFQYGTFYRIRSFEEGNLTEWCVVSKDKKKAIAMQMQSLVKPNDPIRFMKIPGLMEESLYSFENIEKKVDIRLFGGLVNMISPVHLKKDSLVMDVASKFVKLDGEKEEITLPGIQFQNAGVMLKQRFAGTGISKEVAYFQDFCSRLYFLKEVSGNLK